LISQRITGFFEIWVECGRRNVGSKYVCKDGPVFSLAELNTLTKEY
jgi:NAD(P)H-flavin reductase